MGVLERMLWLYARYVAWVLAVGAVLTLLGCAGYWLMILCRRRRPSQED